MLPNAFIGKAEKPSANELAVALGRAKPLWDQLIAQLASECKLVTQEWNSSSPKNGWALRIKVKKRNVLYLFPCRGALRIAMVLGDRAVEGVRRSTLPRKVIRIVEEGKRYPEGTAVQMDVTSAKDIVAIVMLASIKLQY